MTQTITNCNTISTGTMYPVEHLRTAESIEQLCDYVDAGHPIAAATGNAIRMLRASTTHASANPNFYKFDYWGHALWLSGECNKIELLSVIKLAPLAYKDWRPLHVGDRISVTGSDTSFPIDIGWILTMVEDGFDWHIV